MLNIHREIVELRPLMRRVVASVLRTSRYASADHVDECTSDVVAQALDYGARTFDPSKGSARSHFTCFAKQRAINWLQEGHRRFAASAISHVTDDGEAVAHADLLVTDGDPFTALVRARDRRRMVEALARLTDRERSLVEAYVRLGSWCDAAEVIGVSTPTAARMKAKIIAQLQG